jgi:Zn-dependent protease with chaperone function
MIALDGVFHDGRASASFPAKVRAWPEFNCLNICGQDFEREYPLDTVKVSSRVGNIPRRLDFPDGASFETSNHVGVDALQPRKRAYAARRFGGKGAWLLAALLFAGLAAWLSLTQGIPYLAERAAYAIPAEAEAQMGRQALQALDKLAFSPTKLTVQQQERGRQVFASLLAGIGDPGTRRLEFRAMKGNLANAFILPSGLLVVTDRLLEIASQDKELQAVLAHGLGHAHYRHPLRLWLQNSVSALLAASVPGDANAAAANAAALPAVLLQSQYSHAFEEQADDFAVGVLERRGVARCHLGVVLGKLEAAPPKDAQPLPAADFPFTHPSTEARIQRLQGEGKTACGRP